MSDDALFWTQFFGVAGAALGLLIGFTHAELRDLIKALAERIRRGKS